MIRFIAPCDGSGHRFDAHAIATAAAGVYPDSIEADISIERLGQHFVRDGQRYRIARPIRDMCEFSTRDPDADWPIKGFDLIVFRTLAGGATLYDHRLRPGGTLWPGTSEARADDSLARQGPPDLPGHYGPACMILDAQYQIVRFSGPVAKFLEPMTGSASLNLFRLLHTELRAPARRLLKRAMAVGGRVQKPALFSVGGRAEAANMIAERLADPVPGQYTLLLAFQDGVPPVTSLAGWGGGLNGDDVAHAELVATCERLHGNSVTLTTANAVLESRNAALHSVNADLNSRADTLVQTNDDLTNLFDNTSVATLCLDNDLRIRRFTPAVADVFDLTDADEGRPISDFAARISVAALIADARSVLRDLSTIEREVLTDDATATFLLRIRPYRGRDNGVGGVLVTLADISERKRLDLTVARNIADCQAAEDRASALMTELDHRVKNILAVVSSVVSQTLRAGAAAAEVAADIEGRIMAIARAHNLVADEGGAGSRLRAVFDTELKPFLQYSAIRVDGPGIALTSNAAMIVALAVYELTTNAVRHGALSVPGGQLDIAWTVETDTADPALRIVWQEQGGPAVTPPEHRGFGTKLIEFSLVRVLHATVEWLFDPAGVRCVIAMPLSPVVGSLQPD